MSKIGDIIGTIIDGGESILNEKGIEVGVKTSIHSEVSTQNVLDALLKGVVTEEVKELRYKNYKINEESEKFQHIGNGVSIKNEDVDTSFNGKNIRFFNNFITEGFSNLDILEKDIKESDLILSEKTSIEVNYKSLVSVNIKKYITHVDLFPNIEKSEVVIYIQKPFIGCSFGLKKIYSDFNKYKDNMNKCDFISDIVSIETKINKHEKQMDICLNDLCLISSEEKNGLLVFKFSNNSDINTYFISDKYYNGKTDDKYKNKSSKNASLNFNDFV